MVLHRRSSTFNAAILIIFSLSYFRHMTRKLEAIGRVRPYSTMELVPRSFGPWKYGISNLCLSGFNSPYEFQDERMRQLHNGTVPTEGLIFVKPTKTASSTTSGVNLRIARNLARRLNKTDEFCSATFEHAVASVEFQHVRNSTRSFLWTMIREPTQRLRSHFFHFQVSRGKMEPTDTNFKEFSRMDRNAHHYLRKLPLKRLRKSYSGPGYQRGRMQSILDDYNFIGITERMDESLVVLQMLLNLNVEDTLYINSKSSGSYDDGRYRDTCTYILPSFTSEGMQEYFDSPEWKAQIHWEEALYEAANRSLDLTIDKLGFAEFSKRLNEFRRLQNQAQIQCQKAVFPCQPNGKLSLESDRDCMWYDSGCGTACLDGVAATARKS